MYIVLWVIPEMYVKCIYCISNFVEIVLVGMLWNIIYQFMVFFCDKYTFVVYVKSKWCWKSSSQHLKQTELTAEDVYLAADAKCAPLGQLTIYAVY